MSSSTETPNVVMTPEEMARQIRLLREQVPEFTLKPQAELRQLLPAAVVNAALIQEAINAIAASPSLADALRRDPNALRGEQELIVRWMQTLVELDALRSGIAGMIRIRQHRLTGDALRAYKVCLGLARYAENAELLPHIEAMRRVMRQHRSKRRTAPLPPPAPQPEPEPEPRPEPAKK